MTVTKQLSGRLTTKGLATRQRIVRAAADLIYQHGVQGTNNELLRKQTGISGSQLSHYFPDKESLVHAVIAWQAETMMGLHQDPPRGELDSLDALRAWADSYTERDDVWCGGCTFGSLSSEVIKSDLDVHDEIAAGFDRWRQVFVRGLRVMRDRGELRSETDPERLASVLTAAFQGGMLLAQGARDTGPLRAALGGALDYVATFTG
jgi:TetR/AcrR family transcriptional regulator, transcriptional repressor for nem operon